jgi:hypothetical protein
MYEVNHAAYGTLAGMTRVLTRTKTFNAIVAIGEGASSAEPVRGMAIDDNSTSPTYFYGRFGQVPAFYTSAFLETEEACVEAAEALLQREIGLSYSIGFTTPINPTMEPYDVVSLKFSHREAPQVHVLDTITIPFTETGVVDAATREQRVTLA